MSTTRTDIHRPSLADPADYEYLGCFYQGGSADMTMAYRSDHAALSAVRDSLGARGATNFEGNHSYKGTCDHCGANFAHGVCFLHVPTNQFVKIGHICAETTIGLDSKAQVARARAEKAQAEANKRRKLAEEAQRFIDGHNGLDEALNTDHHIVRDIKARLLQWGSISEKQVALVFKIAADVAAPKAPEPTWVQAPEGKRFVNGLVLTVKGQEGPYGYVVKMLVACDAEGGAFKLWVTCPSSLSAQRGDKVRFSCTIERSKDDETFAFGKRPTKAEVLWRPTGGQ